ncbi:MAG: carbon-nitrogen hydrolase family protein [Cyanobacteria bacterium P01_C01_bin.120]
MTDFERCEAVKLAIAQTRPIRGNVAANLIQHQRWVTLAARYEADVLMFPELSLTGYEPSRAKTLAMSATDPCLEPLQQLADRHQLTIAVGMPMSYDNGVSIGVLLFHPNAMRQAYLKQYLHSDEEPFFHAGRHLTQTIATAPEVAIAICYELSVPAHAQQAAATGAQVYLASVAKSAAGIEKAAVRLAAIAQQYSFQVMMVNCVGPCEDFEGAGGSAVWNREGSLLAQLDSRHEALLILDTETDAVIMPSISES